MKRYPKIVQCDGRGQIVIPKDIRRDLHVDEGTGFWMYSITDEGILLKKVDHPTLESNKEILTEINEKAEKLKVKRANVRKSVDKYQRIKEGNLDVI
jgi:AbrB family looped-hinge helix DNA binding protein